MPGGFSYLGNMRVEEDSGEIVSQAIGSSALLSTCCDGVSLEVSSTTGKLQIKVRGDTYSGGVPREQMSKYAGTWLRGDLAVSAATAGVFQVENETGESLIIDRIFVQVVTATTAGAGTYINVGMGSAVDTSYDNLLDTLDITATGAFDNLSDGGTLGKSRQLWPKNQYVNASCFDNGDAAESPTDLVGYYAIHVIDIAS